MQTGNLCLGCKYTQITRKYHSRPILNIQIWNCLLINHCCKGCRKRQQLSQSPDSLFGYCLSPHLIKVRCNCEPMSALSYYPFNHEHVFITEWTKTLIILLIQ